MNGCDRPGARRASRFRRYLYFGLLAVVLLSATWGFLDVLGFYFTKGDTGATLYASRIRGWGDAVRILTAPFNHVLHPDNLYFRPVTSLSFSLDYALWGLNPLGYHLTDLILHVSVAGLLFRVMYLFHDRAVLPAALGGFFYTLHPILVDVVPAVNHRQETLVALFLLAGLWAFWRYEYGGGSPGALAVALACFLGSAGAKEIGVLFLPLVMVHLYLRNPDERRGIWRRLASTLGRSGPYVAAGVLYGFVWTWITRARGFLDATGTFRPRLIRGSWRQTLHQQLIDFPREHIPFYFRAIFHPFLDLYGWIGSRLIQLDPVRADFGPGARLLSGAVLVILLVLLGRWVLRGKEDGADRGEFVLRTVLSGTILLGAAFPLYAAGIDRAVTKAYHGNGFELLASTMQSRTRYSVADYVRKARRRVLLGLVGSILLTGAGCLIRRGRWRVVGRRVRGAVAGTGTAARALWMPAGPATFYAVWLILPALFYSITRVHEFSNMYSGVLPFSALLGTLLVASARALGSRVPASAPGAVGWWGGGVFLVTLVHAGMLLRVSPPVKEYPAWERRQALTRVYHGMLREQLSRLPSGSSVRLHGVVRWTGEKGAFPHFRTAPILNPRPWVKIWYPEASFRVSDWSVRNLRGNGAPGFWLDRRRLGSHDFQFVTRVGGASPGGVRGAATRSPGGPSKSSSRR